MQRHGRIRAEPRQSRGPDRAATGSRRRGTRPDMRQRQAFDRPESGQCQHVMQGRLRMETLQRQCRESAELVRQSRVRQRQVAPCGAKQRCAVSYADSNAECGHTRSATRRHAATCGDMQGRDTWRFIKIDLVLSVVLRSHRAVRSDGPAAPHRHGTRAKILLNFSTLSPAPSALQLLLVFRSRPDAGE